MKSTAIKFGDQTDLCLSCFATTMLSSLAYCGYQTGQTWPYYLSLGRFLEWLLFRDYSNKYFTGGVGAHLAHQLATLDVNNREDCAKKFISNRCVLTVLSFTYLTMIFPGGWDWGCFLAFWRGAWWRRKLMWQSWWRGWCQMRRESPYLAYSPRGYDCFHWKRSKNFLAK